MDNAGDLLRFALVSLMVLAPLFNAQKSMSNLHCSWQIVLVIMEIIRLCLCSLICALSLDNVQIFPLLSAL